MDLIELLKTFSKGSGIVPLLFFLFSLKLFQRHYICIGLYLMTMLLMEYSNILLYYTFKYNFGYNVYSIAEYTIISMSYYLYFKNKVILKLYKTRSIRYNTFILLGTFFYFGILLYLSEGLTTFGGWSGMMIACSFLLIASYAILSIGPLLEQIDYSIYSLSNANSFSRKKLWNIWFEGMKSQPFFYISIGIALYFSGMFFTFTFLRYFSGEDYNVYYQPINTTFNVTKNLLIAYGFYRFYKLNKEMKIKTLVSK